MATHLYQFLKDQYVGGASVATGESMAIWMRTGEYASYDTVTLKLTLYPNAGNWAVIIFSSLSVEARLVTDDGWGATGALPGGLPTPIEPAAIGVTGQTGGLGLTGATGPSGGVTGATGPAGTNIVSPPAAANSAGTAGSIAVSGSYLYICTSTNTWLRAPINFVTW